MNTTTAEKKIARQCIEVVKKTVRKQKNQQLLIRKNEKLDNENLTTK